MKLVYLQSAAKDLLWMKRYYEAVFPQGKVNAATQFHKVRSAIISNPYIGIEVGFGERIREFYIPKTPFSYLYRIKDNQIEIMRVFDSRSNKN
jgi:plasmid stabilization system protein ParE